jgi:hypothetical protein
MWREHLYERVLDGLVGIVRVPEIVIGDPDRTPLLTGNQVSEPLAGGVAVARDDQRLIAPASSESFDSAGADAGREPVGESAR